MTKKKPSKLTTPISNKSTETAPPQYKTNSVQMPSFFFKNNWLALLIIFLFSLVLYIQTIGFDYVLDDTMVIVKNQFTQKGIAGIPDIFRYESFRGYFGEQKQLLEGDRYRPLSIATFAVEQSLFKGNPHISHGINILLYALTGLLLFRVLVFMFPLKNNENNDEGKNTWFLSIPFIATLLFMAHPLHTEVVANIKGRDEIIALFGELGTLYFTFKYLNNKKSIYLFYSFSAFLIGILSKESVITFLAIVPLTAHFFTQSSFSEKVKITLPAIAATLIYLIMRTQAIGYLLDEKEVTDLMNNPFYGMTGGEKTATIFYTFLMYLKLLIFPHPLTHDYYPYQIPLVDWSAWQSILALVLYGALGFVVLRGWKTKSIWAYSAAFYLVTFSIVSNLFVSVGTFMNERFMYHASLGFCIAVAYFLNNTGGVKKAALAVFALLILGFSLKTLQRNPDWRNSATLNEAAIKNSPNSARANCFYAVSIWENTFLKLPTNATEARKKAVLDSMKPYFDEAVRILPSFGAAHKMRTGMAAEYHKMDKNYDNLLKVFEDASRLGTYQPFVMEYLEFISGRVQTRADAEKLMAYHTKMLDFYKKYYPSSGMAEKYEQFLKDLQGRMVRLN